MQKIKLTLVASCMVLFMGLGTYVRSVEMMKKEIVWPSDKMQYKEVIPGVTQTVLWGDPSKGKYGAITKFAPGTMHKLHTHTNNIKIVVISGTFVYKTDEGEWKLGPGSYLLQPGGKKHISGTTEEGCTFFQEGSNKFDMIMIDSKPEGK